MNKTHEKTPRNVAGRPKPRAQPAPAPAKGAPAPAREASELEGEGSYSAARRYDEGLKSSVARGDAERLAQEAARALDGPEGAELQEAEQAAKRGHSAS